MSHMTEWLASLGGYFPFIVIGCVEILLAIFLLEQIFIRKQEKKKKYKSASSRIGTAEAPLFLATVEDRENEVSMLIRRKDRMPVYATRHLKDLLGISMEDIQRDFIRLEQQFQTAESARRLWEQYGTWDRKQPLSAQLLTKAGAWIEVSVNCSVNPEYDQFVFRDITQIHNQIKDYETALDQAEKESQSKTTFLSRMSHEIRTPMNGIIGMLSLAEGKVEPGHPVIQYLQRADELSGHLLSLINDILDMSRIEAGKVELEHKPFSLKKLGNRLYDMFSKDLEARGIRYEVDQKDMSADYVIGDELRISQIIINFLSNAVKFTEKGEIVVTFRQMSRQDGMIDLMIQVHDTGIGMEPEFINRIFRPFEQEGIETSKKYGGTGLGMAITDQLVRLMGGEIVVKSKPGEGSDFSVFLHLPETMADPAEQVTDQMVENDSENSGIAEEQAFVGRRILMAEDNEINAMIGQEILENMGAEVEIAVNGQEAVDFFVSHPERYYDFILMDVQMPVMDGREAARTIRSMDRADAGEILIFALSADAFVEDERMSIESGMNGHYAKPVDFKTLRREISRFLSEKTA